MAWRSSDWDQELDLVQWKRFVELGREAGLREGFLSGTSGVEVIIVGDVGYEVKNLPEVKNFSSFQRAVLFATCGRGEVGNRITKPSLELAGWPQLNDNEATALCANLSSNTTIKQLLLGTQEVFGTLKGCMLLADALATNSTLTELDLSSVGMGSEAVRCLMSGLHANKTLETLLLGRNPLLDEGIGSIREFLCTNSTLQWLDLIETQYGFEGAKHLSSALEHNTTLRLLVVLGNNVGRDGMKKLLEPLSQEVSDMSSLSDGPKNTTLEELILGGKSAEDFCVESVARMVKTNKTLTDLRIGSVPLRKEDWTGKIFPAVRDNESLKYLGVRNCGGLVGEDVREAIMNLVLESNTRLREIGLWGTGMESWEGRVNEELRVNEEYRDVLRNQTQVSPTSGRLVLCGYEFAGKTAIRNTIERVLKGTPCIHHWDMWWKKLMRMHPGFRQFLFGRNAYKELKSRTRGFDVLVLTKHPVRKSIWDFAGQREFYALHDYLFPDVRNSCFLYVSSCLNPEGKVKQKSSMKDECLYWIRFLSSNSKPRQGADGRGVQLPYVKFVLTNKDMVDFEQLNLSKQWAESVAMELKGVFQDVIDLCETVEVVDAHSEEDVEPLIEQMSDKLVEVLENRTEYAVCKEVRSALDEWSAQNMSKPVLSLEEFHRICEDEVRYEDPIAYRDAKLHLMDGQKAVLAYLNDMGDIIYHNKLDFIVVNPRWFGISILGNLIDPFGGGGLKLDHEKGFVKRRSIDALLQQSLRTMNLHETISGDTLVQLMIHMEMCFEKGPGNDDSLLFLPALFDDKNEDAAKGLRQLEWKFEHGPSCYIGRRLECENKKITFLTPGFFPRLQVHLLNYIQGKNWTDNSGFDISRNLIRFTENGYDVCVEYSGDIDYFVDVMVRSSKPFAKALQFIEEHVINNIVKFCTSRQGCQGVLLTQAVIRPICVEELHLCVERKPHSVLVSKLRDRVKSESDYEHTWSKDIEGQKRDDFALELLEGKLPRPESSFRPTPGCSSGDLCISSIGLELPTLLYPSTEDVELLQKLVTKMNVSKAIPIKLHLMCDHKDGSHKVDGQRGRTMKLNWKAAGYNLPIAQYVVTFLCAQFNLDTMSKCMEDSLEVREIPDISAETLQKLNNANKTDLPFSEQEILKCLRNYMTLDPTRNGFKQILNLHDGKKFDEDFQLNKVVYTEPEHAGKIGWLCERHFNSGLRQGLLRSRPLM